MADIQLFSNNASTTLSVALTSAQISATVADGSVFESPAAHQYELLTITDGTNTEIVKLTARSGNTLTITREQEGTTAPASFAIGSTVAGRVTAGTLDGFPQGADNTGDALGTNSLEYQSGRASTDRVASGDRANTLGYNNKASGNDSLASGSGSTASAAYTLASGASATASAQGATAFGGFGPNAGGTDALAIGTSSNASAANSAAIGKGTNARIAGTANLGPICIRKDNGETDLFEYFAGAQVILMTDEVDLTSTADDVATITIASNAKFFPDECGVIITSSDTVTGDPNVEFGITGTTDQLLTATTVTETDAAERTRFTSLADPDGQTTLTLSVETGATATALLGRGYFKGMLVEDE